VTALAVVTLGGVMAQSEFDATVEPPLPKTLVAQQPTYLPYLGLLHKVAHADVFVVQDNLRYVKDEVSNRNRIAGGEGWKWLTIPVHQRDGFRYVDVMPASIGWHAQHRRVLEAAYRHAPYADRLTDLYELTASVASEPLATINLAALRWMIGLFDINVKVVLQSELAMPVFDNPNERLLWLASTHGCTRYLSGVGGRAYIEPELWDRAGVELAWSDYAPTPYDRGWLPWISNLSAIDAIALVADLPALLR
jgi:hypothetical protein